MGVWKRRRRGRKNESPAKFEKPITEKYNDNKRL
jgi:hypothetical protein